MSIRWSRLTAVVVVAVASFVVPVVTSPAAAAAVPGGSFQPLAITRILDTRNGTGAPKKVVAAKGVVKLKVTGVGGVPDSGVAAVLLNVRVVQPATSGAITAWADGTTMPSTVTLFFSTGQTVAQNVPVKVGSGGLVDLYNNSAGSTQLLADVTGYYTAGSATSPGAYTAMNPTPLVNTSSGLGVPKAPLAANSTVTVQVTGKAGIPSTGVGTVSLSVSVTKETAAGSLVFTKTGSAPPTGTSLDFAPSQTSAQLVIVPVDDGGRIDLRNASAGTVTVYADVLGYTAAGESGQPGAFRPLPVTRMFGGPNATGVTAGADPPVTVPMPMIVYGVGPLAYSALVLKVSIASGVAGTATLWADNNFKPANSQVTFLAGQVSNNLVIVPMASNYSDDHPPRLLIAPSAAGTLTVDIVGYVTAGAADGTTGTVAGRIVDSTGKPRGGVKIHLDTNPYKGWETSVVSTPDGYYAVPNLRVGDHTFCVDGAAPDADSATGYLPYCFNDEYDQYNLAPFQIAGGQVTVINVTLQAAGGIRGVVTDTSGKKLRGVGVGGGVTDAAGAYVITGLRPTTSATVCFSPGPDTSGGSYDTVGYLAACYLNATAEQPTPVTVGTGFTSNINQALSPAGAISGTVTRSNGSPCACSISIYASNNPNSTPVAQGNTDPATGKYTIKQLAGGTFYVGFAGPAGNSNSGPVTVVTGKTSANVNGVVP